MVRLYQKMQPLIHPLLLVVFHQILSFSTFLRQRNASSKIAGRAMRSNTMPPVPPLASCLHDLLCLDVGTLPSSMAFHRITKLHRTNANYYNGFFNTPWFLSEKFKKILTLQNKSIRNVRINPLKTRLSWRCAVVKTGFLVWATILAKWNNLLYIKQYKSGKPGNNPIQNQYGTNWLRMGINVTSPTLLKLFARKGKDSIFVLGGQKRHASITEDDTHNSAQNSNTAGVDSCGGQAYSI